MMVTFCVQSVEAVGQVKIYSRVNFLAHLAERTGQEQSVSVNQNGTNQNRYLHAYPY